MLHGCICNCYCDCQKKNAKICLTIRTVGSASVCCKHRTESLVTKWTIETNNDAWQRIEQIIPDIFASNIGHSTIVSSPLYCLWNALDLPMVMVSRVVWVAHYMESQARQIHDPTVICEAKEKKGSLKTKDEKMGRAFAPDLIQKRIKRNAQVDSPLFFRGILTSDDVVAQRCLLHDTYHLIRCQILELPNEPQLLSSYWQTLHHLMPLRCECEPTALSANSRRQKQRKVSCNNAFDMNWSVFIAGYWKLTRCALRLSALWFWW